MMAYATQKGERLQGGLCMCSSFCDMHAFCVHTNINEKFNFVQIRIDSIWNISIDFVADGISII